MLVDDHPAVGTQRDAPFVAAQALGARHPTGGHEDLVDDDLGAVGEAHVDTVLALAQVRDGDGGA